VEGTSVCSLAGDKFGSVDDIMIDEVSGRAIYAVMSFGGFLGMGEKYHPLPWATLKYDAQKGGYVVNLEQEAAGRRTELRPQFGIQMDARLRPQDRQLLQRATLLDISGCCA
jgi:hypothetical protein